MFFYKNLFFALEKHFACFVEETHFWAVGRDLVTVHLVERFHKFIFTHHVRAKHSGHTPCREGDFAIFAHFVVSKNLVATHCGVYTTLCEWDRWSDINFLKLGAIEFGQSVLLVREACCGALARHKRECGCKCSDVNRFSHNQINYVWGYDDKKLQKFRFKAQNYEIYAVKHQ